MTSLTSGPATPNKSDIDARLTLARALADHARTLTLPLFTSGMVVENKAGGTAFDPVTNADKDAELALRGMIIAAYPDDAIVGEEFDDRGGTSGYVWTLDPIDGTRGFVAGIPVWSTLIALGFGESPIIGIMDFPAMGKAGERYIGSPDGSLREDAGGTESLSARKCEALTDVILGCTEPLAMFTQGERASYEMIRRTAKFSRLGLDAYGYAMVASGRMDMIIEADLKPCDVRALIPVIQGAGGKMTDWHGASPINGGRVVAAGNPAMLDEVYPYLQRAMDTKI